MSGGLKVKWPWVSIFTIEFLLVLLLLLALFVFIFAAREIFILKNFVFDEDVFNTLKPFVTPAGTSIMKVITFFGKHTLLIPLNIALLILFIYRKERWFATRIAALSLTSVLLSFSLKFYFQRERPILPVIGDVSGYSFPSGHAMISMVFYGLFIHMVWHEVKQNWLRW